MSASSIRYANHNLFYIVYLAFRSLWMCERVILFVFSVSIYLLQTHSNRNHYWMPIECMWNETENANVIFSINYYHFFLFSVPSQIHQCRCVSHVIYGQYLYWLLLINNLLMIRLFSLVRSTITHNTDIRQVLPPTEQQQNACCIPRSGAVLLITCRENNVSNE